MNKLINLEENYILGEFCGELILITNDFVNNTKGDIIEIEKIIRFDKYIDDNFGGQEEKYLEIDNNEIYCTVYIDKKDVVFYIENKINNFCDQEIFDGNEEIYSLYKNTCEKLA